MGNDIESCHCRLPCLPTMASANTTSPPMRFLMPVLPVVCSSSAPGPNNAGKRKITREECVALNGMAEEICNQLGIDIVFS